MEKEIIIGIDLGTTNSLGSVIIDGRVVIIPDANQQTRTPSIVSITENNDILVGFNAQHRLLTHPEQTASVFKRNMGTKEVYRLGNLSFQAYELSSLILKKIKRDAEVFLNQEITKAIISVPAYFNNKQRKDTIKAAQLAGIDVIQLLNEPTAAALAYGMDYLGNTSFLVFDLGGGTFDVTFLEIYKDLFEVRAMSGDSQIGGEDFTRVVYDYICLNLPIESKKLKPEEKSKLWEIAEESKRQVDYGYEHIEFELRGETIEVEFTQNLFYELSTSLFQRLLAPIQRVLIDADGAPIDRVIFVGGATRMEIFRRFVKELLEGPEDEANELLDTSLNPDEAIVLGVGHAVGILNNDQIYKGKVLSDIAPFSLGIEIINDEFSAIIERNTHLPISAVSRYFTTQDNQKVLNVPILQGENIKASRNLEIGRFQVEVPQNKKGEEAVDIQFTYDISGVLGVKATVVSTGVVQTLVYHIDGNDSDVNDSVIEKYQMLPIEEEENYQLLSQALLYSEQITGEEKGRLGQAIVTFTKALNAKSKIDILKNRENLKYLIEKYDKPVKITFRKKNRTNFDDILN